MSGGVGDVSAAWRRAQSLLRVTINTHRYETWIEPLEPVNFDDGVLTLDAGTASRVMRLERDFRRHIESAVGSRVHFVASDRRHERAIVQMGALVRSFAEIERVQLNWLWPGRIPLGKPSLLVGDPGLGKSLVTVDIAARLSRGVEFADGAPCETGRTIILSAEDDPGDTIGPRLDAANADVRRVHLLEAVRVPQARGDTVEKQFSLETDLPHLEDALKKLAGVRLIVIDPLSAYLGGIDSHSNAETRSLLSPLAAMAERCGVAVLAVTHLRKSAGPAVHRAIGSIAFAAAARSVWVVALDPDDRARRLILPVKQNLSAQGSGLAFRVEDSDGVARIAWETGTVALDVNDVLAESAGTQDGSALEEACEWLQDELAEGPLLQADVIKRATREGFSVATLRRAKKKLGIVPKKNGFQGRTQWQFKDAHPPVSPLSTLETARETKGDNGGLQPKVAQSSDVSAFGDDDDEVRP
ncbi:MAG: AAA family ATPase [Rhizomicrobium sp.]